MRRFLLKDFSLGIYIMTAAVKRTCACAKHFCFYNSIKYAFGDYALSPMTWTTPSGMKQFLKIAVRSFAWNTSEAEQIYAIAELR